MAPIGHGYGSEFHLLRYLGRHRNKLNEIIIKQLMVVDDLFWLDFESGESYSIIPKNDSNTVIEVKLPDKELRGIDFLDAQELRYTFTPTWAINQILDDKNKSNNHERKWGEYWPTGKGIMNWDAVALIRKGEVKEWLLVEAKAHTGEISSACQATASTSIDKIKSALEKTATSFNLTFNEKVWMEKYYQFANRLAVLNFLREKGIDSNLLYIYFYGDQMKKERLNGNDAKDFSPDNEAGWKGTLNEFHDAFSLKEKQISSTSGMYELIRKDDGGSIGVYELFLPVIA